MLRDTIRNEELEWGEHAHLVQLVSDFKEVCEHYDIDPEATFAQVLDFTNRDGGSVI